MKTRLLDAVTTQKNPRKLLKTLQSLAEKTPDLYTRGFYRGRTVFHLLIQHQHYTVLKALLEDERLRALACQADDKAQSILHLAILHYEPGTLEHIEWLCECFPLMINAADANGNTPLHLAVSHKFDVPEKIALILCLVKYPSTNRWIENREGKTPFTLDEGSTLFDALQYVDVARIPMPSLDGELPESSQSASLQFSERFPRLSMRAHSQGLRDTPRWLEASSSSSTMESLSSSSGDYRSPDVPPALETPQQEALANYCLHGGSLGERRVLRESVFAAPDGLSTIHSTLQHVNWHLANAFNNGQMEKKRQWHTFLCHLVRQGLLTPPLTAPSSPDLAADDPHKGLSQSLWLISTSRESEGTPRLFTLEKMLHQTLGMQLQADLPTIVMQLSALLEYGDQHQRMCSACMVWLLIHFNPLSAFRSEAVDVLLHFHTQFERVFDFKTASMLRAFQKTCTSLEKNPCARRARSLAQWPLEERFKDKPKPIKEVLAQALNPRDPQHIEARRSLAHDARALTPEALKKLSPDELRRALSLEDPCKEETPVLYLQKAWWQGLSEQLSLHALSGDRTQLVETQVSLADLGLELAGTNSGRGPDIHGLMCLSSALNHQAVSRAMATHCTPTEQQKTIFSELNKLLSSDKNREHIRLSQQAFPDTLPFVGHMKSDLYFAAVGAPDPVACAQAQGKQLFALFSLKARLGHEIIPTKTTLSTIHESEVAVSDITLDKLSHRFLLWPVKIYDFYENPLPVPATLAEAIDTLNWLNSDFLDCKLLHPESIRLLENIEAMMKGLVNKSRLSATDLTALAKLIPLYHESLKKIIEAESVNRRIPRPIQPNITPFNLLRVLQMQLSLPAPLQTKHPFCRLPPESDRAFPSRLRPFFSAASSGSEASSSVEERSPRAS